MESRFFNWHQGFTKVLNRYPFEKWVEEVAGHVVIGRRFELERDPAKRQLLPYIIVRQRGRDGILRYMPYRRTKKGGEPGLHDQVSIGYGGHIDFADIIAEESIIQLQPTIMQSALREMKKEELKARRRADAAKFDALTIGFADEFIVAHFDVHMVHLGIVMIADLPAELEIESAEDQLVSMPPMCARELLDSGLPIEYWSQVYLEAHLHD
jgi:predicted NUDIX family phosphoesterase